VQCIVWWPPNISQYYGSIGSRLKYFVALSISPFYYLNYKIGFTLTEKRKAEKRKSIGTRSSRRYISLSVAKWPEPSSPFTWMHLYYPSQVPIDCKFFLFMISRFRIVRFGPSLTYLLRIWSSFRHSRFQSRNPGVFWKYATRWTIDWLKYL